MNAYKPSELKMSSVSEWLASLEQQYPQSIHFGLERVCQVAERLKLTQTEATVISVAGTNGKGSVVHLLEKIYTDAGYQVGSYTSPHLLRFNERFRVNTRMLPDIQLVEAFAAIEAIREEIFLSYFEVATLVALYCFKQQPLDIILMEVGMGGRLDATNILDADLCVITGIDYDHQQWLGDTLEAIAGEKAGILRPGKPLVYGDRIMYASVMKEIERLNCPFFCRDRDFGLDQSSDSFYFGEKSLSLNNGYRIQPDAVANALMVLEYFQPLMPVASTTIQQNCERADFTGRQQLIKKERWLLLDVAHNAQSVVSLAKKVQNLQQSGQKVHVVFSSLSDKDQQALIAPLAGLANFWYISTLMCTRAMNSLILVDCIKEQTGHPVLNYATIEDAFNSAWQNSSEGDLILVYGSFYTVAAVLSTELYKKIMGETNEVFYG